MKIATTYENGLIFQHFGHSSQFKMYTVEDGTVTAIRVVNTNGSGHGALSQFLAEQGVDVVICGGIGGGAVTALSEANIQVYGGVSGDCDMAVANFLAGKLAYDPNVKCDHHDHHHGDGHTCGEHGCGEHSCH